MGKAASLRTHDIVINPPNSAFLPLKVTGDTPLVMHRFGAKAQKQIADKQQGKAKVKAPPRVPEEEYLDAIHYMPDGKTPAMPAICFKKAAVGACRMIDGLNMTQARIAFFVIGHKDDPSMVPIKGKHQMRTDTVRLESGVTTLRYRPEFLHWEAEFLVEYDADFASAEQIINLFNKAGFCNGIGENRPEKSGNCWGRFHVEPTKEQRKRRKAA